MLDPLTIGMLGADALNLGLNGYNVYKNHSNAKAIEALKGSETIAAAALNEAKEAGNKAMAATTSAAAANQHAAWLHTELDKKGYLPEKPKTDQEIQTEYMKAMTGFMQAVTANNQQNTPAQANQVSLDQATITALVNAIAASGNNGNNNQGK